MGHHPGDLTVGTSVVRQTDGTYQALLMTNEEALGAVTPGDGYAVPYVYSDFEWKHCEVASEGGVSFPSVEAR